MPKWLIDVLDDTQAHSILKKFKKKLSVNAKQVSLGMLVHYGHSKQERKRKSKQAR